MELKINTISESRRELFDSFIKEEQQTVQETISLSIINTVIQTFTLAYDEYDSAYISMIDADINNHISLYSNEFKTAVRLIGLFKGVILNDSDINKISKYLEDFTLDNYDLVEYIEEPVQSLEEIV